MIHCPTCAEPISKILKTRAGDAYNVPVVVQPYLEEPENDNYRLRQCIRCGQQFATEEVLRLKLRVARKIYA